MAYSATGFEAIQIARRPIGTATAPAAYTAGSGTQVPLSVAGSKSAGHSSGSIACRFRYGEKKTLLVFATRPKPLDSGQPPL